MQQTSPTRSSSRRRSVEPRQRPLLRHGLRGRRCRRPNVLSPKQQARVGRGLWPRGGGANTGKIKFMQSSIAYSIDFLYTNRARFDLLFYFKLFNSLLILNYKQKIVPRWPKFSPCIFHAHFHFFLLIFKIFRMSGRRITFPSHRMERVIFSASGWKK